MKTNRDRLVMISVQGEVAAPATRSPYTVGHDGVPRVGPGTGGITYNVKVGDPALGWSGDHVEPGVSIKAKDEKENNSLNLLACIGNEAVVMTGEAKGARGVVTGKHGGIEHVLVHFPPETMDRLAIGDRVMVKACGQGLELVDFPGVRVMNVAPGLLESMGLEAVGGRLRVPVVGEVPPELMGSGMGSPAAERGDYDISTQDRAVLEGLGLHRLRLGDVVAIRDMASFYGRTYRKGAVIIGVVVHCDSNVSGHGPGVTTVLTSQGPEIEPFRRDDANIAAYLGL